MVNCRRARAHPPPSWGRIASMHSGHRYDAMLCVATQRERERKRTKVSKNGILSGFYEQEDVDTFGDDGNSWIDDCRRRVEDVKLDEMKVAIQEIGIMQLSALRIFLFELGNVCGKYGDQTSFTIFYFIQRNLDL